ncbi:hypothetical protein SYNTR_0677 [Candidatus Syntrophocurvum alkaliphilum]|uniref:Uncharacterized protein n=1 Tax=Candidatus Syntrophocurvum alkaliphilum TaxID=2293317 RepID=A0A6I6DE05_9FIRM|nr:hypothetical protein SYNTR_0677 [Candidatus Syntrophocurvum alkaliphilum]
MPQSNVFFDRKYTCPVCSGQFSSLSVRSSATYVENKEPDFHTIYKGVSPLHYSIIVCPYCNYAASNNTFSKPLSPVIVEQLSKALAILQEEEPYFSGERDLTTALRSFQLAIRCSQLKKASAGEIAGLLLASAWLAREIKNTELENTYMNQALKHYREAYEKGTNTIGNLSDIQATYLIGELYRRTGEYSEAVNWFNRAIGHPQINSNPSIEKLARDQWALAREQVKQAGSKKEDKEDVINQEKKVSDYPSNTKESNSNTTVQLTVGIYQHQFDFLKEVANKNPQVNKDQVLKALLDATIETIGERSIDEFSSEIELKRNFIKMLND